MVSTSPRIPPSLTTGKAYRFLLDMNWGGKHWLLTDGPPQNILGKDGTTLHRYEAGLEIGAVEEAIDLWSSSPTMRSASIAITLPPNVSVPGLVSEGHPLDGATATLAVWYEGSAYENRRGILSGNFVQPTYGGLGEPIRASLEPRFEDAGTALDEAAVIGADTWPVSTAVPGLEGARYPLIIGQPGIGSVDAYAITDGQTIGSPGLLAEFVAVGADGFVVADGIVDAGEVYIWDLTNPSLSELADVIQSVDGLGRIVSVADTTTHAGFFPGHEYWVTWTGGGGKLNPFADGPLTGMGDVLHWMLMRSTLGVDWPRVLSDVSIWNAYKLDTYISTQIGAWDWVQANILPYIPSSVASSADGVYFVPWAYQSGSSEAVAFLDADAGHAHRESQIVYQGADQVRNDITIRYHQQAQSGAYLNYRQATAYGVADDVRVLPHYLCLASQARYGARALEVQAPPICDSGTAGLILDYLVHRYAMPYREVAYSVGTEYEFIAVGDVISLTDSSVALTNQVCHLTRKTYRGGGVITLGLIFWEWSA